jgi:hypothetical protein
MYSSLLMLWAKILALFGESFIGFLQVVLFFQTGNESGVVPFICGL